MVKERLNRPNNVHGPFTLKGGRLTLRTGDPALTQRLAADREQGRDSTVCLLSADPIQEFTGRLESVENVKRERPQQWEVVMIQSGVTLAQGRRRKGRGLVTPRVMVSVRNSRAEFLNHVLKLRVLEFEFVTAILQLIHVASQRDDSSRELLCREIRCAL